MTEPNGDELHRLAEAVSDRHRIDWETERSKSPDLAPIVEQLRLVETLAAIHCPFPGQPEAPERATGGATTGADARSEASELPETWGALRILERIGHGGFGEVFRAYDPSLQREVALKLLSPDRLASAAAAERYLSEARRLARVRHPNVLVIHGADRHGDRVGLWTELVRGQTLEERLAQHGPLGADEAVVIGLDLCRALAAVHAAGLVHRDVKAANVMREQGGRIVLMDFGAVGDRSGGTLAAGGEGSPITMAPEQLAGGTVAASTDIYGLGALLYRLVSGRYPIDASSLAELRAQHAGWALGPLGDRRPDLPGELVRVVERALDPQPARRFASAGEMERALASCLGQPAPATTQATAGPGRRGA